MKPETDLFDRDGLESALTRAEGDPHASEELDFLADLVAAAELERARLARPLEETPEPPRYLVRPWILAAAASVLFVLALGAWFFTKGERRSPLSAAASAPPPFVAAELRDPDAASNEGFARAMEPYVRADWTAAKQALEAWLREQPEHGPAHFYLAATLEQLGELDSASEHYQTATRAPDALLSEHARFRLALLLVRRGELARARTELETLQAGGGELALNARELLDELGRR
jgi:tetratricopeptide (TPR) repeat protein